jgi:hypothetical protein
MIQRLMKPRLTLLGFGVVTALAAPAQAQSVGPVQTVPLGGTYDMPPGGSSGGERGPPQGRVIPRPRTPNPEELERIKALPGAPMVSDPVREQKAGQNP